MTTNRRSFLKLSGLAGMGWLAGCKPSSEKQASTELDHIVKQVEKSYKPIFNMSGYAAPALEHVRLGFIGGGMRGSAAVTRMRRREGGTIKGTCDGREEKERAE